MFGAVAQLSLEQPLVDLLYESEMDNNNIIEKRKCCFESLMQNKLISLLNFHFESNRNWQNLVQPLRVNCANKSCVYLLEGDMSVCVWALLIDATKPFKYGQNKAKKFRIFVTATVCQFSCSFWSAKNTKNEHVNKNRTAQFRNFQTLKKQKKTSSLQRWLGAWICPFHILQIFVFSVLFFMYTLKKTATGHDVILQHFLCF